MDNEKNEYVTLDRIKETGAQYNILYGKRSNGKTFAVLSVILNQWHDTGKQGAIIRRTDEDFKGARGRVMWDAVTDEGLVEKYTEGKWQFVVYYAGGWYFARSAEDKKGQLKTERAGLPFCYKFALNTMEHDKSTSYPDITTILFDEFITRSFYLPDEFILFQNTVSTIIRGRDDVTIYMLGNTVNKYSPYFAELGLTHILQMNPGDLDVYEYGKDGELKVAVEYTDTKADRPSDKYFAFDNPKLKMITEGQWELDIYPHLPHKYKSTDVLFYFVIEFAQSVYQGEIICSGHEIFAYVHNKSTPVKDDDFTISPEYSPSPRHCRNILKPAYKWDKAISDLFRGSRVFYQDNTVGDTVNNYLTQCRTM